MKRASWRLLFPKSVNSPTQVLTPLEGRVSRLGPVTLAGPTNLQPWFPHLGYRPRLPLVTLEPRAIGPQITSS